MDHFGPLQLPKATERPPRNPGAPRISEDSWGPPGSSLIHLGALWRSLWGAEGAQRSHRIVNKMPSKTIRFLLF